MRGVAARVASLRDEPLASGLAELRARGWFVVDDRATDRGPSTAILVGPPGVFVVGCDTVAGRRQVARFTDRTTARMARTAGKLAQAAGLEWFEVHPVLCLVGPEVAVQSRHGVAICASDALAEAVGAKQRLFSPARVEAVATAMAGPLRPGRHRGERPGRREGVHRGHRPQSVGRVQAFTYA